MSNRDRIAHAALEAEAAKKEKDKAATEKKATPAKKKRTTKAAAKPTGRTRFVWAVCDQTGSTVKTYPYPEEAEARAEAERLAEEKGKAHFVKREEVPFE